MTHRSEHTAASGSDGAGDISMSPSSSALDDASVEPKIAPVFSEVSIAAVVPERY